VFPPAYTGALMNGQGLAGLVVSLSDIITLLFSDGSKFCDLVEEDNETVTCQSFEVNYSAFAYFLLATVVLASCILLFFVLRNLSITQ
jgi:hypothetical protein